MFRYARIFVAVSVFAAGILLHYIAVPRPLLIAVGPLMPPPSTPHTLLIAVGPLMPPPSTPHTTPHREGTDESVRNMRIDDVDTTEVSIRSLRLPQGRYEVAVAAISLQDVEGAMSVPATFEVIADTSESLAVESCNEWGRGWMCDEWGRGWMSLCV